VVLEELGTFLGATSKYDVEFGTIIRTMVE